jgi:hypothetical protein
MTGKITQAIHIPSELANEVNAAGMKLSNRLWLAMLRERLAIGHFLPLKAEEWSPGEQRVLQLPLPFG